MGLQEVDVFNIRYLKVNGKTQERRYQYIKMKNKLVLWICHDVSPSRVVQHLRLNILSI